MVHPFLDPLPHHLIFGGWLASSAELSPHSLPLHDINPSAWSRASQGRESKRAGGKQMEESETTRDGHDPKNISEASGETFFSGIAI